MNQMIPTSSACLVLMLLAPSAARAADENTKINSAKEPAPLSVAPLDHIEYPEDRPDWVSAAPSLKEFPHTWVVVSGPSDTPEESAADLKLMERAAIATYIKGLPGADGRFDFYPITDEWIENELVCRRYAGQLTEGGMERYEHAVELRFDKETQKQMLASLKNVEVRERLGAIGVLVFTGLIGLICSSAFVGMLSRRAERRASGNVSVA